MAEALLDDLEAALEVRAVAILERGATDYSQTFDIAVDKHVFIGMVGPVEGEGWLLFVESTLPWWKHFRKERDETEHGRIMQAIQEALTENPRIEALRLYRDADQWNQGTAIP